MTVYPFTLHLGPLAVTGFGLMMMVAFLMSGWAIQMELRRRALNEEYAADIVIGAVVGGLIGAKLWYVALTGASPFERGGFVWYGGFLGGAAGVILAGVRRRVPLRLTAEVCAPALALGYALGRVGCFLVQDDYGIPTTLPWGMKFPQGLPATTVANLSQLHVTFPAGADPAAVVAVHPTEIYETAVMLLVFAWLWRHRDHRHATGWLFAVYLVCAGRSCPRRVHRRAGDERGARPGGSLPGQSMGDAGAGAGARRGARREGGSAATATTPARTPVARPARPAAPATAPSGRCPAAASAANLPAP